MLLGVEGKKDGTQEGTFIAGMGIGSWDDVVRRWSGIKWANLDEDFDALAGASLGPSSGDTFAIHL